MSTTIDPDVADPIFSEVWEVDSYVTINELRDKMRELDEMPDMDEWRDTIEEVSGIAVGEPLTIRSPRDGVFLMTVKRGERWYVSPSYTVAEYARQILDLPPADFALSRVETVPGAASPAGVVDDVVGVINSYTIEQHLEALVEGDPDGIYDPFSVLTPYDEFGALIDYSPAFAAMMQELSEETQSEETQENAWAELINSFDIEGQASVSVDIREEERQDGDVVLYFESGSIRADFSVLADGDDGDTTEIEFDASWDGLCAQLSASINGESEDPFEDCVPADAGPEGLDEVFVVVGEIDGSWYVSYVETFLAYLDIFIEDQLKN